MSPSCAGAWDSRSGLYQVEPLRLASSGLQHKNINEASDETKDKEGEKLSHGRKQQITETI